MPNPAGYDDPPPPPARLPTPASPARPAAAAATAGWGGDGGRVAGPLLKAEFVYLHVQVPAPSAAPGAAACGGGRPRGREWAEVPVVVWGVAGRKPDSWRPCTARRGAGVEGGGG